MSELAEAAGNLSPGEEAFELWRKRVGVLLTPAAFAVAYWLCDGLTPQGRTLSAILAAVGVLWVTEVVPLPVTALVGAVLCVVLGVAPADRVLANFADPIVFVFIGSFILARAMMLHRLDRRIAMGFLSVPWVGGSPARMMGGIGLVTAVLSMWVSNTATTAMMLPIALGVLSALHQARVDAGLASGPMNARAWPFATGMMLMVAYAASIGGIGTPVGSPPNLIAIGLIKKATGVDIGFFTWMKLCVPLLLAMGAVLFLLLIALHPSRAAGGPRGSRGSRGAGGVRVDLRGYVAGERAKLGEWTRGEFNTLVAFGVAVLLWMLPGLLRLPVFDGVAWPVKTADWMKTNLPESVVALVAAILLFVLPVDLRRGQFTITWDEAAKIDWGTILLFGGGLALGALMFDTGVAKAMGEALTAKLGVNSLWAMTALAVAMGIVLSEATSNTAAANMLVPVAIAIAQAAGVSPLPPALGACLGASYGFMLPVSTPPNAIAYGSGLVPITRMVRAGVLFDVLGFFVIIAGLRVLCPLLGLV